MVIINNTTDSPFISPAFIGTTALQTTAFNVFAAENVATSDQLSRLAKTTLIIQEVAVTIDRLNVGIYRSIKDILPTITDTLVAGKLHVRSITETAITTVESILRNIAVSWIITELLPIITDGPENYGQNTPESTGDFIFHDPTPTIDDSLSQFTVHHNTFWHEQIQDQMPDIVETLSFEVGYQWYFGDFDAPIDENLVLPGFIEPGNIKAG